MPIVPQDQTLLAENWTERTVQGFTMAATIADDPQAAMAAPGLAPEIVDSVTKLAQELARLDPNVRRKRIRDIASMLSPTLADEPVLPPPAQALLARTVSKRVGRSWLQNAKPPRPGFRPEPALVEVIRRIAWHKADSKNK
jgi:hypothetical protein